MNIAISLDLMSFVSISNNHHIDSKSFYKNRYLDPFILTPKNAIKQKVYLLVYHKYVKTLTNYMNSGCIKLSPICRLVTEVSTVCIIAIFIFATCCTLMEPVTYIIFEVFKLTCINKNGLPDSPFFQRC